MSDFHLRVVTPERTMIDRKVRSVQFMGVDGSYGILPHHAALLTATTPGIVTIEHEDGKREELLLTGGFADMRDNVLSLVCDAGEAAGEIDVKRAEAAEARARAAIDAMTEKDPEGLMRARYALQRAQLRQLFVKRAGTGYIR